MTRPRVIGMAWFDRADYPRALQVMADSGRLPDSYDLWQLSAEQVESTVIGSGVEVVRARIDPDAFVTWCAERAIPPDGAARARFANDALPARD